MYELDFTEQSQKEIAKLRKSDAQAYKKLKLLLAELREHPYIGTGHPHQLRYVDGMWSRKLDKKIEQKCKKPAETEKGKGIDD